MKLEILKDQKNNLPYKKSEVIFHNIAISQYHKAINYELQTLASMIKYHDATQEKRHIYTTIFNVRT